jgi:excisionase family DNA binding protein
MVLPDKPYYRVGELARELERAFGERVPVSTIYEWIRREKVMHVHVGRKLKIARDEVQRILARGIEIDS